MKYCTCKDPKIPSNLPLPPDQYKGTAICSKCLGLLVFPLKLTKEMVENFRSAISFVNDTKTRTGMDSEKALLILLADKIIPLLERQNDLLDNIYSEIKKQILGPMMAKEATIARGKTRKRKG